jgi:hypothetical protein
VAQITESGHLIKEVSKRPVSAHYEMSCKCEKRKHAKNGTLLKVEFERRRNMRQEGL